MSIYIKDKQVSSLYLGTTEIVEKYIGDILVYKKKRPAGRFRFKNVSDKPNTVKMTKTASAPIITLERSNNGVDYVPCDIYTGIDLQPGEVVYLRGNNKTTVEVLGSSIFYNSFTSTDAIECHGSLMDICDGGTNTTTLTEKYQFKSLFNNMITLTTAPELPATTLTPYCYNYMFNGCTSLTTTPELPATTLVPGCYNSMFSNCTSLTTAPELPATKLTDSCYGGMFTYCTSLTTAPELPATILAGGCYNQMFYGCTSLTTVHSLPATELADDCYLLMFYGCVSLTTAPELPAIKLTSDCYYGMFEDCSKLDYVRVSALSWNNSSRWLSGVSPTGTFYKPKELTNIPIDSPNGIPKGWKVVDI